MKLPSLVACLFLAACGDNGYTLYRNSVLDSNMRVYIASFSSGDGDKYNNENCNLAARLFQQQPGVETRFWCEKGEFKK